MINLSKPAAVFAFVSVVILTMIIAYYPSLTAPFYMDGRTSITENPAFAQDDLSLLWQLFGSRFVGYFSLYLNYLYSSENPALYRVVNLLIHLANGVLLVLLYRQLCQYLKLNFSLWLGLILVALWLVHPLHSAAVTYVVQRLASLATLFGLLTLYSYMRFRTTGFKRWLMLSVIALVCAVLTKQNAVVLPVMLYVLEWIYGPNRRLQTWLAVAGAIVVALVFWLLPEFWQWIDLRSRETTLYSRWEYFSAQWYILLLYWAKLFYLYPLQLDMTMPLQAISHELKWMALAVHCSLLLLAALCFRRLPLVTIGVCWFYLLHFVESGLIPIVDLAFEHRAYFPDVALVLVFIGLLQPLLCFGTKKVWLLLATTIFLYSSQALYQRNELWNQPEQFYLHDLATNPTAAKAMASLGAIYASEGKLELANDYLTRALEYQLKQDMLSVGILVNAMKVRFEMKDYQSGVKLAHLGLSKVQEPRLRSDLLAAMATGYINMGYCDFARGLITTSLKLNPANEQALQIKDACVAVNKVE